VTFIRVDGLTKRYGAQSVVDGISFDVARGELLTFLGPSGCGKTTTLRCIAGFIPPDAGTIQIDGKDMTGVPPHRRHLGMVFQNYALFPHLTVFENVAFGLRIRSVDRAEATRRVERALDMVRLGGLGGRMPRQLSGGQQQRVALARALVYQPGVLLLDEPLSNLDAKLRVEMRAEIRALQREIGVTAVYVTHDQEEALSISDRVLVLNQGRIEQLSTPWDLYNRPATSFVAGFVGTSNLLSAQAADGMLRVADAFNLPCPVAAAGPVWLVARPESITIVRPENGAGPRGVVRSITLLGATLRLGVEIVGGSVILADLPHGGAVPDLAPGGAVAVRFDPSRIVLIPR
jgi:putative spermidine/putrescine transport system ATP-binding protein